MAYVFAQGKLYGTLALTLWPCPTNSPLYIFICSKYAGGEILCIKNEWISTKMRNKPMNESKEDDAH